MEDGNNNQVSWKVLGVVGVIALGLVLGIVYIEYIQPKSELNNRQIEQYTAEEGKTNQDKSQENEETGKTNERNNQPPNSTFNLISSSGNSPLGVTFDASRSSDEDGDITDYDWDFGDGNTGSGETPTHTYESSGVYRVKLTVTDDKGATNLSSGTFTIPPEEKEGDESSGYEASISESCEEAFEEAASVSQYQDTNEDMNPAFSKCETIREFKKASEEYPDALDGADPEMYINNRCNFSSDELSSTPICKAWEKN